MQYPKTMFGIPQNIILAIVIFWTIIATFIFNPLVNQVMRSRKGLKDIDTVEARLRKGVKEEMEIVFDDKMPDIPQPPDIEQLKIHVENIHNNMPTIEEIKTEVQLELPPIPTKEDIIKEAYAAIPDFIDRAFTDEQTNERIWGAFDEFARRVEGKAYAAIGIDKKQFEKGIDKAKQYLSGGGVYPEDGIRAKIIGLIDEVVEDEEASPIQRIGALMFMQKFGFIPPPVSGGGYLPSPAAAFQYTPQWKPR